MPTLRLVLGDQLSMSLSSLADWQDGDGILMCEVMDEASYVPHHKKKLAFVFSAMRHFAEALEVLRQIRAVRSARRSRQYGPFFW
jgi:deoxyribodipyrimidine photolyase-related protein